MVEIQKEKIAIIVPAYNIEKYIKTCIASLLEQTYSNLEIIIVNDGSTDKTLEILEDFAQKDSRIQIITQKNQGVSAARNNALKLVSAQYVMFVDSDDWLNPEACEYAINIIKKENADVAMFGYVREYEGASLPKAMFEEEKIIFEGIEVKNKLCRRIFGPLDEELASPEKLNAITTIWGKIYKTSLIRDCVFVPLQEVGLCEDGVFNINVFQKAKKVIFFKKYFYHYRKVINGGSLTQKKGCNIWEKEKKFYNYLKGIIKNNSLTSEYLKALENRMTLSLIEAGISIVNSDVSPYAKIKEIIKSKEYRKSCQNLQLKYFPLHWKMFFWCAKYQFTLGTYLFLKIIVKIMDKR